MFNSPIRFAARIVRVKHLAFLYVVTYLVCGEGFSEENLNKIVKPYFTTKVRGTGLGLAIVSTSIGIMTDNDARTKNIGGEIICKVF